MRNPKRRRSSSGGQRRGAAAVEFAVVAPLFFLVLAGIIEFGQAFRIEHALSNASRRAARSAIFDSATVSGVESEVQAHCARTLGFSEGDVTVEIALNGTACADLRAATQGDEISVTVSVPYSRAGVGFYANLFSNSTLSSTCIFEHE
jgi:Flp pilus assembly protein TadG